MEGESSGVQQAQDQGGQDKNQQQNGQKPGVDAQAGQKQNQQEPQKDAVSGSGTDYVAQLKAKNAEVKTLQAKVAKVAKRARPAGTEGRCGRGGATGTRRRIGREAHGLRRRVQHGQQHVGLPRRHRQLPRRRPLDGLLQDARAGDRDSGELDSI